MWFQEEQGSCLVTYTAVDTKLMYLLFWERSGQEMIARGTLDKKYTVLYNFPLYYQVITYESLKKKEQISNF